MCNPYIPTAFVMFELSFIYYKRYSVEIFKKNICVKYIFLLANSADPDEISHLDLHCLFMF